MSAYVVTPAMSSRPGRIGSVAELTQPGQPTPADLSAAAPSRAAWPKNSASWAPISLRRDRLQYYRHFQRAPRCVTHRPDPSILFTEVRGCVPVRWPRCASPRRGFTDKFRVELDRVSLIPSDDASSGAVSGDKVLRSTSSSRAADPIRRHHPRPRSCRQIEERDEDVDTPARHDVDRNCPASAWALRSAGRCSASRRQHATAVVAHIDQQVFAVAVHCVRTLLTSAVRSWPARAADDMARPEVLN